MERAERQNAQWITLSEAASMLECSKKTVRRRIKSEGWETQLDKMSDGRSVRKVRKGDVLAHIESNLPAEIKDKLSGDKMRTGTDSPESPVQNVRAGKMVTLLESIAEERKKERKEREKIREARETERDWQRWIFYVTLGGTVGALGGLGAAFYYFMRMMQSLPKP